MLVQSASVKPVDFARSLVESIAGENRRRLEDQMLLDSLRLNLKIWSDPVHITFELLQNADDAGAKRVEILLTGEELVFSHDGVAFNERDVRGLSRVGRSWKRVGNYIGFMGIGFKSVFKLTDRPFVFSGSYRFSYDKDTVIVPQWEDNVPEGVVSLCQPGRTVFYLPLRRDLPDGFWERLGSMLKERLDTVSLLGLRNILSIRIQLPDSFRVLRRVNEETLSAKPLAASATVEDSMAGKTQIDTFLLFRESFKVPNELRSDPSVKDAGRADLEISEFSLSFSVGQDGLKESGRSVFYAFLPTDMETGLAFVVNADFILDTSRSMVDWTSKWNHWLSAQLNGLLLRAVEFFKARPDLRSNFYRVLPKPDRVIETLAPLVRNFVETLKGMPVVLTSAGEWAKPDQCVILDHQLQAVVEPKKFDSHAFVHPDATPVSYLKEVLGVNVLDNIETVIKLVQDEFWLSSQPVSNLETLLEFTSDLLLGSGQKRLSHLEGQRLETILRKASFLPVAAERFARPDRSMFPNGKEGVATVQALPPISIVHPLILGKEKVVTLLKHLGVHEYSQEGIARLIVEAADKRGWTAWSEAQRFSALEFLSSIMPESLSRRSDVLPVPVDGGEWAEARQCYLPSPLLRSMLPNAKFVDLGKLPQDRWGEVYRRLELLDFPKVQTVEGNFGRDQKPEQVDEGTWSWYWDQLHRRNLLEYPCTRQHALASFSWLDGFSEAVLSHDTHRLTLFFQKLCEHWTSYEGQLETTCNWFYYSERERQIPSHFALQLAESIWLATNKGLRSPHNTYAPLGHIKKTIGDLVPFLDIAEQTAKANLPVFKAFGIRVEIEVDDLLQALERLPGAEIEPRKILEVLYLRLATLASDPIGKSMRLLTLTGGYRESNEIWWSHRSELREAFARQLPTLWMPDTLTRKQIDNLIRVFGMHVIDDALTVEVRADGQAQPYSDYETHLKERLPLVQSIIAHYQDSLQEDTLSFLKNLRTYQASKVTKVYHLPSLSHQADAPAAIDLREGKLFLGEDANHIDIAQEIASAAKLPDEAVLLVDLALYEKDIGVAVSMLSRLGIRMIQVSRSDATEDAAGTEPATQGEAAFGKAVTPKTGSGTMVELGNVSTTQPTAAVEPGSYVGGRFPPDRESDRVSTSIDYVPRSPTLRGRVLPPDNPMERGREGERLVMVFEEREGRLARDVSTFDYGYDIYSKDSKTGEERFIEVKAFQGYPVSLTENERRVAGQKGERYYLYVVESLNQVRIIRNPLQLCKLEPATWKLLDWSERGDIHPLAAGVREQ